VDSIEMDSIEMDSIEMDSFELNSAPADSNFLPHLIPEESLHNH